jgi:glycosyltransferase involved in cell wall biosynthesis
MVRYGGGIMKKTVLLRGPVLTRSGYGEQARFALRALRSREDMFDIFIHPLQWGHTGWISEMDEERSWIDQNIEKTISYVQNGGTFDISVQVTIPNEFEKLAGVNIGYTAGIETTKCALEWLDTANRNVDKIIFVSTHSKNTYDNTTHLIAVNKQGQGRLIEDKNDPLLNDANFEKQEFKSIVETHAVNYPVKKFDNLSALDLELTTDYNFVCVAQFGPRKNLQNTINWFVEEFHDDADAGLIVKTNVSKNSLIDRETCEGRFKGTLANYPDRKCKVYLLHGDMTDKEMHEIYLHDKVFAALSLTHGEGFGLPLFEAAYMGAPVVAPGWSGQMDFLCGEDGKENFYNVAFDLNPVQEAAVWKGVILKDSMWAHARENSAKEKMRECYNDAKEGKLEKYSQYADTLAERFDEDKMYAQFIDAMGVETAFDVESWLSDLDIEEVE